MSDRPIQLTFGIDDGIPRSKDDKVLCVSDYSHFCGRRGRVTDIIGRMVYVVFENTCIGEVPIFIHELQRLTQTGGGE
ncbi:MAG: hypothetical protein ACXAB9_11090 [Candidatus Thorarchaeota archaeon]|jgi:hypothetical protein